MEPTAGSTSSTETEREPAERVALGRVVGAHGMGGQIRVRYFGGAPDNLMRLETALLAESEDAADAERFEVTRAAPGRREEVRMTLAGVADRESAERLRGKLVVAEASQLEALPEGEYYSYQLVGCRVEGRGRPADRHGPRSLANGRGRRPRGGRRKGGAAVDPRSGRPAAQGRHRGAAYRDRDPSGAARLRVGKAGCEGAANGWKRCRGWLDVVRDWTDGLGVAAAGWEVQRMRRIDVITIFPGLFEAFLDESIVGIAIRTGRLEVAIHDLRDWTTDPHRTVDDSPYGGGPGMVMKPETARGGDRGARGPQGPRADGDCDRALAPGRAARSAPVGGPVERGGAGARLRAIRGRGSEGDRTGRGTRNSRSGTTCFPGVRFRLWWSSRGSLGWLPGSWEIQNSIATESFQGPTLEGPQYTRPAEFRGRAVPPVLLSGDHGCGCAVASGAVERNHPAAPARFAGRP